MPSEKPHAPQQPSPCDVKALQECLQRTNGNMQKASAAGGGIAVRI